MYMYEKKSTKGKAAAVILMTMILILISGFFIANSTLFNNRPVLPVNQPDAVASLHIPVVLPADETVAAPFAINAKEVLHFFEKTKSEDVLAQAVTEFEGVYRPNQGLDYAYDGKVFEATAMLGGTVTEVKEDAMFGKSVTVKTGEDLEITVSDNGAGMTPEMIQSVMAGRARNNGEDRYSTGIASQSLSQVSVKKDQVVNQNDVLGLAGENIYNKDLGIHLHVVVQKDGQLIDPATIIGMKPAEIK